MSRILVIKLGALGDFVQAFGAFASIRAAFPHDSITLLTTPPFVELAKAAPWFDDVTTDRRPSLAHPVALLRLSRALRGFDRIFDLQTSGRSRTYFRLAGRPRNWSGISDGCCHPHANPSRNEMHTLTRLEDQLCAAGVQPIPREVPDWLKGHGPEISGRSVVLIPGAAPHRPQKRWPVTRFSEVAQAVAARGLTPVIVGCAAEKPLAEQILQDCPSALDLTGQTSLIELAGVLHKADLVIGNDTGPIHLAAAMDRPIIALFSQDSDPRLTAPLSLTPGRTTILDVPDLALLPASRIEALLPR
ncbi:glycosyltransferase family 9 protein [Gluconobacter cerinus]|uniref:glycosyltransferase family 9 protein n=1 Tax=Gluconobacter cerinus TaxID=38307 RepID=UPI001B8B1843|nr:glycosyltransferase family 9 protein [Gluconobacter cerinus]MBS1023798.1 glycosyltransferase family 9 protein [Gluconobacter cerinus]MBS1044728.1 glycosyltransferase family 9 protein [Gluconobacter cerinus]